METRQMRGLAMWMRTMAWLGLAVWIVGFAGCPKELSFQMDPEFSVNLVRPAAIWPKMEEMTPAEMEAHEKFGKPDFFRLWYNRKGEIANSSQAGPTIRAKLTGDLPRSWVYEQKGIEVSFPSEAKFETAPLSDKMKVLCRRGDAQAMDAQSKKGVLYESWMYYDVGEKYYFIDGHLDHMQHLKALGTPFARR